MADPHTTAREAFTLLDAARIVVVKESGGALDHPALDAIEAIAAPIDALAADLAAALAEAETLREALRDAAFVGRRLLAACDDSAFDGAIGPEGQKESDYRIARISEQFAAWTALASSEVPATDPKEPA